MSVIILNIICFVLFPCIVFYQAEYQKSGWRDDVLTKDDTAAIRGIAAIFVVFAHYLTYIDSNESVSLGPVKLYEWCGGLGVCVFFFASGYGIWNAYRDREVNAMFLWKRFQNIVPIFVSLRLIFGILLKKYTLGIWYYIQYVFGIKESMWFVSEIVLIYLLYYIACKLSKKNSIILMTVFLAAMSVVFYLMDFEPRWYNANLVFVVGMLLGKYKNQYIAFMKRNYWLKLAGSVFLFCVLAIGFTIFKGSVWANGLKLLAGAIFSLCFMTIVMKMRINSEPILFLGRNSLQLYIIHLSVQYFFEPYYEKMNLLVWFSVCLIISILITIGYYYIDKLIKIRYNKHIVKKQEE